VGLGAGWAPRQPRHDLADLRQTPVTDDRPEPTASARASHSTGLVATLQRWMRTPRLWPVFVVVAAAALLAAGLGSFGFWDPHEIRIADLAKDVADGRTSAAVTGAGAAAEPSGSQSFTVWLVATSIRWLGVTEFAARLPLMLLGLLTVAACCGLGWRLASPRAGVLAGLFATFTPMLVLESRQLIGAGGISAGAAVALFGLAGLAWPAAPARRARWRYLVLDGACAGLGLLIGAAAAGILAGVFVPVAALAGAGLLADRAAGSPADCPRRVRPIAVAAAVTAAAAVGYTLMSAFKLVEASPGDRAMFGVTLQAGRDSSLALHGIWRANPPELATWDALFEQIAFGFFPWLGLGVLALARAATGRGGPRSTWAGHLMVFWALWSWVVGTLLAIKVGPVRYGGFPALAVAAGLWVDDLLQARAAARPAMPTRQPMGGLLILLAALVVGKDLNAFPEQLVGLHVADSTIKLPDNAASWLTAVPLGFALVIGAALCLWLAIGQPQPLDKVGSTQKAAGRLWPRLVQFVHHAAWVGSRAVAQLSRHGLTIALASAGLFAVFLAWLWTPILSQSFSYKPLFDRYAEHRRAGAPLGILGMPGSGPEYYAPDGSYTKLANRNQLFGFLAQSSPVFAMAPRQDLCAVHQAAPDHQFSYYVLDNSHAKFMLLSNQLPAGFRDDNPIKKAISRQPPAQMAQTLDITFDNQIKLIGVTIPRSIRRGATFRVHLYYEILAKPHRNWQVFVHFDGAGLRFQGDHWPVDNQCGTAYWQPGDYIVDSFEVRAGDVTSPLTTYQVWMGFFVGSHGNWTNMKVSSGSADANNRVRIGTIDVY
jgi:4-amino-4-deoxy-L-arabinose transferase-like glycosyltransferase